jgi:hypothetical protein
MSSPNKSTAMQTVEVTTSSDTCIKTHVIRRFFEEMAEKHKVKIDRLNVHITDGTLYIQEYDAGRYETFKLLEMHVLNGV